MVVAVIGVGIGRVVGGDDVIEERLERRARAYGSRDDEATNQSNAMRALFNTTQTAPPLNTPP